MPPCPAWSSGARRDSQRVERRRLASDGDLLRGQSLGHDVHRRARRRDAGGYPRHGPVSGFTRTEFHERADMRVDGPSWMWLDAGAVARQGVRDCERGVVLSVPSRRYWAAATAARYTAQNLRAATKPKEFR